MHQAHRRSRHALPIGLALLSAALYSALTSAPAQAGPDSCRAIKILGPAPGRDTFTILNTNLQPIANISKLPVPLSVQDCSGDLFFIKYDGQTALVRARETKTNQELIVPDCPTMKNVKREDEYDNSSQGMGGSAMCKKASKSAQ